MPALNRHLLTMSMALAFAGLFAHGHARSPETAISIQNKDLARDPLYLERAWLGGMLRLYVSGVPRDDWTIRFDYGAAGVLEMTKSTAEAYFIGERPKGFEIDVPIMAGYSIFARSNYPAMRVQVVEAITTRSENSEQMIAGSNVVSIGRPTPSGAATQNDAFARVDVLGSDGTFLANCTAFRIARGYWMTAAHCVYRSVGAPTRPQISRLRLQPDAYANKVEQAPAMLARPVASGLQTPAVTMGSLLADNDLDYALLEAEKDGGGTTIPLDHVRNATEGTGLFMLHYWRGEFDAPTGKAMSQGAACTVLKHLGDPETSADRPDLCRNMIQHGCSSQGGGSGAPLLDRDRSTLVALHYGAGRTSAFNCGLPASAILTDLCQRHPTVARKVTTCP